MSNPNPIRSVSSFLPSPRFLNALFSPKTLQDQLQESSPTSILDTNPNSVNNPFEITKNGIKPMKILKRIQNPDHKFDHDHEGIALALIDDDEQKEKLNETIYQPNYNNNNNISRKVLFASNLKIQIPELISGDYGIKTRNSQFSGTPVNTPTGFGSPRVFSGPLSLKEMELSEEYTRVISHGPNPKTTHIYDNCVVDCGCGVVGSPDLKKPGPKLNPNPNPKPLCDGFLSFCHTCNKNLEEGNDIFIYRGEKAFCSEECRCQEMVLDGLMMNS